MHQIKINDLHSCATFISQHLSLHQKARAKTAIVLGSGLAAFAEKVKQSPQACAISFNDIPHFSPSTVDGHKGELVYGLVDDNHPVLIMNGRIHLYEGHEPQQVITPIRVLGLLGVSTLILTNASGALGDNFEPGQLMVISDHINLSGTSPLVGKNCNELGPRFLDMSNAYDKDLIMMAKTAATAADIKMHEGTYASVLGPCYETPAEIRMLKSFGVDAVGMSTVFETIAARHMGLRVLGISCLTNKAAGLTSSKITHEEVMENNAKVSAKLSMILRDVVRQINSNL